MSTPAAKGVNVDTVEQYRHLLDITEQCQTHLHEAERLKRLQKVEWAKFFRVKKEIKELRAKMGIPINDKISITKELATEFVDLTE